MNYLRSNLPLGLLPLILIFQGCSDKDTGLGFTRNYHNCTSVFNGDTLVESSEKPCSEYDEYCPCGENACGEIHRLDSSSSRYVCLEDGSEQVYVISDGTENINVENPNSGVLVLFNNSAQDTLPGDINIVEAAEAHIVGIDEEESVLKGNINLHDGRVTLRNVTIMGDLSLNEIADSSGISHCNILGNLNIHTPGTIIRNCNVFGNINVDRDSVILIDVGVMGRVALHGVSIECHNVFAFQDSDSSFTMEESEIGPALECVN